MSAEQYLREGKLSETLDALQLRIRSNPAHAQDRVFLFQLLAVLEQWERAAAQLKVANDLDASTLLLSQIYGRAIDAENDRARVFRGEVAPSLIGHPDEWVAYLLQSLQLCAQGHLAEAAELRTQAYEKAPASIGTINGEPFEWIADADSRLGPCLELMIDGRYFWTSFANVRAIRIEQPSGLSDVVWIPCMVTWINGSQVSALIPTRYPGTQASGNDALRLARRTEWEPLGADAHTGLGQRVFVTDAGEYALLDLRELQMIAQTETFGNVA